MVTFLVSDPLAYGGAVALVITSVGTAMVNIIAARQSNKNQKETNALLGDTNPSNPGLLPLVKETHVLVNSQHDAAKAEIEELKTELTSALAEVRVLTGLLKAQNNNPEETT